MVDCRPCRARYFHKSPFKARFNTVIIMSSSLIAKGDETMSRSLLLVVISALIVIPTVFSQGTQDETSRPVAGGGVTVSGWTGKVDAREASQGMTVNNAKFAKEGDAIHVVTGPAITYW